MADVEIIRPVVEPEFVLRLSADEAVRLSGALGANEAFLTTGIATELKTALKDAGLLDRQREAYAKERSIRDRKRY